MEYIIKECEHGYLIRTNDSYDRMNGMASRVWAFSTLREAQEYLPNLFAKQEQ